MNVYRQIKDGLGRLLALSLFIGLFILPIIPLTLLAIVLEDGFPVFFYQKRVGQNGNQFNIFKFRSMYTHADRHIKSQIENGMTSSLNFKKDASVMVTKVGAFIRKTSIDELPQLINIIKGDMAIIGPRPLQEFEVAEYASISEKHQELMQKRLSVKPGLLCYWQVTKNKNDLPFDQRMKLDAQYVDDMSFRTDIKILFLGIKTVLFSSNV